MALTDIPTTGQPRRLDSWKEIAEYLGRDVRTATRWEAQGMPLHRVPGGRGTSVFAFAHEIDAWMAGKGREAVQAPPEAIRRNTTAVWLGVTTVVLAIAVIVLANTLRDTAGPRGTVGMEVSATPTAVSLADASGVPHVIYQFEQSARLVARTPVRFTGPDRDGRADIAVAVSYYEETGRRQVAAGELLHLSSEGDVRWRFGFDDVLALGEGTAGGPWALADWQARTDESGTRFAVAAHDYLWWASLVAVLDRDGRRISTFFNPGWMESLLWLDGDRLAVSGFSNERNAAMLALLDARGADGQAPGLADTPFACANCSSRLPSFYAVFPRSELNVVTGGRFNRAAVSELGDQVLVTTEELPDVAATAIYEFDSDMRFTRARYSETYWDMHRRLESDGRLKHTREVCPERDGPTAIFVWSAGAGWVRTSHQR